MDNKKILEWLLDSRNVGVRYFTLLNIYKEPADSPTLATCREEIYKTRPVADILAAQTPRGRWGSSGRTLYTRYTGTYWQVHFLAELGAGAHPGARAGAEYLLTRGQTPAGAFSPNADEKSADAGLTANTLKAMLAFGMYGGERLEKIIQHLIETYRKNGGYPCPMRVHELEPMSRAALPKVILSMTAIPDWKKREDVRTLVEDIARDILSMKIFITRPKRTTEWVKEIRKWEPKNIEVARKAFLEEYPDALEREPEEDWLSIGFPNSDLSTDILENLRALAAADIPYCEDVRPALDALEKMRSHDMTWKMDRTLEPMLVPIEKQGEPSKWLTMHALNVLRSFGRWLPPTKI